MIDFLCIGAQKAGTTWLMGNLSKHPKVWTPRFAKEVHYFDRIHLGHRHNTLNIYRKRCQTLAENNPKFASYFERVLDPEFAFTDGWYQHIFSVAPPAKKKGECTPMYGALPDEGIQHIKRLAPDVSLIFMIRDPLQRALSSLRMEMNFRQIRHSSEMEESIRKPLFAARGRYSKNVPRWDSMFGLDQILYIPFGDIKSHPEQVMRQVEKHLRLKPYDSYPRLKDTINKTTRDEVVITDETVALLEEVVEGESEFLRHRFGQHFLDRTK